MREPLSALHARILALVARGHSNAEIARRLSLTYSATCQHVSRIYVALDLHEDPSIDKRVMAALIYLTDGSLFDYRPQAVRPTKPPLIDVVTAHLTDEQFEEAIRTTATPERALGPTRVKEVQRELRA